MKSTAFRLKAMQQLVLCHLADVRDARGTQPDEELDLEEADLLLQYAQLGGKVEAARQLKLLELQEVNHKLEEVQRTMTVALYNRGYLEARKHHILQDLKEMKR